MIKEANKEIDIRSRKTKAIWINKVDMFETLQFSQRLYENASEFVMLHTHPQGASYFEQTNFGSVSVTFDQNKEVINCVFDPQTKTNEAASFCGPLVDYYGIRGKMLDVLKQTEKDGTVVSLRPSF